MKPVMPKLTAVSSAQELKQRYQKNMFLAEVAIIAAIAVGLCATVLTAGPDPTKTIGCSFDSLVVILDPPPPPPIDPEKTAAIEVQAEPQKVELTLPEPAPDEEVTDDPVIASRDDLAQINSLGDTDRGDLDGQVFQAPPDIDDYIPPPDSFIAVEERPQKLSAPPPIYPAIARKAGIEGAVWVNVLVWKDGSVRDVLIARPSGANAGFEEAAIAAARQSVWRPAMQNKQSVPVWVMYEVRFRLK